MNIIKLMSFSLLAFTFSVFSEQAGEYSKLYSKCLSENIDNPMSTNCAEAEIDHQNEKITNILLSNKRLTSPENGNEINLDSYYQEQHKAIEKKCSLWLETGGQNGVLLEKQCILNETVLLEKLLSNFVSIIDG